ncbi:helix-turn-helix domain-containing protein [Saccharopolyspora hordei]|uniref:helix-turn-helix domain-containing protein n=1 Tax=Saccharopolyspora hordei TaxID=1838 RepID=UPI0031E9140C
MAKAAFCDRTTVTHIEKGRARADERFWQACDDAVGADGVLLAAFHDLVAAKQAHDQQEQQTRLAQARARAKSLSTNGHAAPAPASPMIDTVGLVDPPTPSVRLDSGYVETLRSRIGELVDLDIQFGGDQSSGGRPPALPLGSPQTRGQPVRPQHRTRPVRRSRRTRRSHGVAALRRGQTRSRAPHQPRSPAPVPLGRGPQHGAADLAEHVHARRSPRPSRGSPAYRAHGAGNQHALAPAGSPLSDPRSPRTGAGR